MLFKNLLSNSLEANEQNENSQTSLSSAFTSDGEASNLDDFEDEEQFKINDETSSSKFKSDFINKKRKRRCKK